MTRSHTTRYVTLLSVVLALAPNGGARGLRL